MALEMKAEDGESAMDDETDTGPEAWDKMLPLKTEAI